MEHSELVVTLRIFSQKEKERLLLFLQSPYCTGVLDTQNEYRLARYIFDALGKTEKDVLDLENQQIYTALYPNRTFSPQTLNNLATSTLKLVRQFMEAEVLMRAKRPVREHALIVQFLSEKGAVELCEKYLKRLDRAKAPEETWDDTDFYLNWRAENIKSQFLGMYDQLSGDYNLQESLQALEKFYRVEQLNLLSTLFNQNRLTPILSPQARQEYLDELETWARSPFARRLLVQLYRKVLSFFHLDGKPAEEIFQEFIALLAQSEGQLSLYHIKRMEAFAYNFCARRFSQEQYRNILFQLFNRWIEPERLQANTIVHANDLLSLVQTGLVGKQYEWVEKFLETYRERIQGIESAEDYYGFNRALYLFHLGDFDQARDMVVRLNFHDIHYKYLAKTLEIKLFFETGEEDYELVDSKLNSLNVALHRENKMTKEKKKRYNQFVHFMMRLHRWRGQPDPDPKWLEKIREDVRNARNTAEWRWLMKKLDELKDGK